MPSDVGATRARAAVGPNLVIAGERRCGTTSLYHWMRCHPDIYLYPGTDLNYFVDDEITGIRTWREGGVDPEKWDLSHTRNEYLDMFARGQGYAAVGHKGADLLFWRPAHPRMANYLEDARFIVTLRNPVNRAWSHYWNEVGKGREPLGFSEALAAEEQRSAGSAYAHLHLSYLARGFYEESLANFFEFFPRERVLVVTVEQTRLQPRETLCSIYRFVGVDPDRGHEAVGRPRNENWTMLPRRWAQLRPVKPIERAYRRAAEGLIVRLTKDAEKRRRMRKSALRVFRQPASSLQMPEALRRELSGLYAPHVRRLEVLLGRQFPEWRL
jgi:hypothetical protein